MSWREAGDAHWSSIERMNAGTPAVIAPGVSVVGIMISVICSSSANCSALIAGPEDGVTLDLREKRVSAAAPPRSTTAPSSSARRFTFPSFADMSYGLRPR